MKFDRLNKSDKEENPVQEEIISQIPLQPEIPPYDLFEKPNERKKSSNGVIVIDLM
jgi:hypothetical protein